MKWSDCAVQDLKKYAGLKACVHNIEERIEALEMKFTGIKGSRTDKIPAHGGGSKWEDQMLDNIVERERLKMLYKADVKLIAITERGLNALNNIERTVLERFFIYRSKDHVERLIQELGVEQSQVYRIKDQALYKFTIHMYGIEEY
jgi:DNA-directed RNA polymerase specialized sigma subunit